MEYHVEPRSYPSLRVQKVINQANKSSFRSLLNKMFDHFKGPKYANNQQSVYNSTIYTHTITIASKSKGGKIVFNKI